MLTRSVGALVVLACLSFTGCLTVRRADPGTADQDIEAVIRAVQAQLRSDAERLDAAALYAHVLDAPTPIIEDGRIADTKAAALARTERGFKGVTKLAYTYTRDQISVLSPTIALWVGEGTATATLSDGRAFNTPFAESVLFAQREGRWMVLHAHRSAP